VMSTSLSHLSHHVLGSSNLLALASTFVSRPSLSLNELFIYLYIKTNSHIIVQKEKLLNEISKQPI
jgi:hypothetical protein